MAICFKPEITLTFLTYFLFKLLYNKETDFMHFGIALKYLP